MYIRSLCHPLFMLVLSALWLWGCTPSSALLSDSSPSSSASPMINPSVADNTGASSSSPSSSSSSNTSSPSPSSSTPSSPTPSSSNPSSPTPSSSESSSASPELQNHDSPGGQQLPILAKITLGNSIIDLEVTRTEQEQAIGLMFRRKLPDNRGMLFEFSPPRPVQFWMKNMIIPLDMVFVREGKIIAIAANVPPCRERFCPTYGPNAEIDQVIELRAGLTKDLGIKAGDSAVVKWLKTP